MTRATRRETVLAVTLEMIAEMGLSGLSTRQVAKRAGVSEGLIFHHFGTREGLLAAAAGSGETLLAHLEALAEGPPADDLGAAVDLVGAEAARRLRPGGAAWAFMSSLGERNPKNAALRAEGLALLDRSMAAMAGWMDRAEGTRPVHGGDVAARGLFEGILYLATVLPDDPAGWDAAAPAAFSAMTARWRTVYLGEGA